MQTNKWNLNILMTGLIGFVVFYVLLAIFISAENSVVHKISLGDSADNCEFTMDIPKNWSESAHGYVYGVECDFAVENYRKQTLTNWNVQIELINDCYIDSMWNGNYEFKDNIISFEPVEYNMTIEGKEKQTFGFIIYTASTDCVKSAVLTYNVEGRMVDYLLFWIVSVGFVIFISVWLSGVYFQAKNERLRKINEASQKVINESFLTFANMIDAKDSYTKGHSQRVAYYARELAVKMGVDEEGCKNIFYIGLLHDIGKIGVQDAILKKNTKLTYDEFNEIKEHVSMGGDILKNFTAIEGIEGGARYHHEKYDGTGYMEGLSGEAIPLFARIIAVADAFDSMSSKRCYRDALDIEKIIAELKNCSGTQFDPRIVPYMLELIEEGKAPAGFTQEQLKIELQV